MYIINTYIDNHKYIYIHSEGKPDWNQKFTREHQSLNN